MTLSRTPLRISFVGGGTDIANFYREHGGEVISTAIDKYISVRITNPCEYPFPLLAGAGALWARGVSPSP